MNLLEAYVTEILGPPVQRYDKWWVPVKYTCWGHPAEGQVMCNTKEEAEGVDVDYVFLT